MLSMFRLQKKNVLRPDRHFPVFSVWIFMQQLEDMVGRSWLALLKLEITTVYYQRQFIIYC